MPAGSLKMMALRIFPLAVSLHSVIDNGSPEARRLLCALVSLSKGFQKPFDWAYCGWLSCLRDPVTGPRGGTRGLEEEPLWMENDGSPEPGRDFVSCSKLIPEGALPVSFAYP